MDSFRERMRVLAPHYFVILVLLLLVLVAVDSVVPDLPRIWRWVIVGVVAITYVVVLRATGRAPEPWA